MLKKTKIYLASFLLIFPLLLAGCASGNNSNNTVQNKGQNQAQNAARAPMKIESENLVDGAIGDLTVGSKIMTMGNENSDGSIIATQIIMGENYEDFMALGRGMSTGTREQFMATSTRKRIVASSTEQRFDFAQFQNMSDEERASFRQNMADARGGENTNNRENLAPSRTNRTGTNGAPAFGTRNLRTNGEIISIGDGMITVKLQDGGSRLIFYSDQTVVNNISNKKIEE